jgi:hypothetical protein
VDKMIIFNTILVALITIVTIDFIIRKTIQLYRIYKRKKQIKADIIALIKLSDKLSDKAVEKIEKEYKEEKEAE